MEQFKEGQIVYSTQYANTHLSIPVGTAYRVENITREQVYFRAIVVPGNVADLNIKYANKYFTTTKPTTMKNRFPFNLHFHNAQKIIDIACDSWKITLAEKWGKNMVLKSNISIDENTYKTMRLACTSEQHQLFDEIFGKDEPEFKVGDVVVGWHNSIPESLKLFHKPWKIESINTRGYVTPEGYSNYSCGFNKLRHATPEEIEQYKQSQLGFFNEEGLERLNELIGNGPYVEIRDWKKVPGEESKDKAKAISKLIYDTWCK